MGRVKGRVEGKVAIVTGAARGTGEQTARLLADEGAKVVIADILETEGGKVAEEIGAAARFERLDVTDEASWAGVVEATTARFGPPTVLVNNAGLLHIEAFLETSAADVERLWRVNQLGPFLGMKAVARAMRGAGGGSIVNVASRRRTASAPTPRRNGGCADSAGWRRWSSVRWASA